MDVEKVGKTITYLRKRAGYTQKELADRIGISDKAVSKWERGQGLPDIGYLRKLSILLDTDSDSLLAGNVAHHKSDWHGILILEENGYGIGAGTMIYDKPLINFLLSYFLLVGIKEIDIVCTGADQEYINRTFGDGCEYGIKIKTHTGGLISLTKSIAGDRNESDTCLENEDNEHAGDKPISNMSVGNIMMVYGRCLLYGVDQTRFFQKAMIDKDHFTMLVMPKKINQASRIMMDIDKRVVSTHKGSIDRLYAKLRTQYDFSDIPILFFPVSYLENIAAASSIPEFIEKCMTQNELFVEVLDRGFVEIEVDSWDNVQEASAFLKIVQDKCGMNVYCIEEVAWRRGMINLEQLRKLGLRQSGTTYGDYILSLHECLEKRSD